MLLRILIKVNDELDHIGMYFAYNDYSTRIQEIADEEENIGRNIYCKS